MEIYEQAYEIEVRVIHQFNATHSLPSRPELHGHLWEVVFSVSGPLNPETGMVCDMLILSEFFNPYCAALDGYNLHEFPEFQNRVGLLGVAAKYPTCDTLAHYFMWKILPDFHADPRFENLRLSQIRISIYEPGGTEAWGHAIIRPT